MTPFKGGLVHVNAQMTQMGFYFPYGPVNCPAVAGAVDFLQQEPVNGEDVAVIDVEEGADADVVVEEE